MRVLRSFVLGFCVAVVSVGAANVPAVNTESVGYPKPLVSYNYDIVPGIFIQDDNATIPGNVGAVPPRFGLIDDSLLRWVKLRVKVLALQLSAPRGVKYKVLWAGRHGEGYHNAAEAFYGSQAWNEFWAKQNGNGTHTWGPDAKITPLGIAQAQNASREWRRELVYGIPRPEAVYSSPLSRAAETAVITFGEWWFSRTKKGLVLELLREHNGVNTCDKRSTKTYIRQTYPQFNFEPGFTEQDELWTPDHRETELEKDARAQVVLDQMFNRDGTFISLSAHSGIIRSIFTVIKHRPYSIPTGGVVPVLIKATPRN